MSKRIVSLIRNHTKKELEWLASNYCIHSMSFLEHPNCYFSNAQKDFPVKEKIGFLDIECSGLSADFSYIFSYAIKELDGDIIGRVLTPKEIRTFKFDENLTKELCYDLEKFDRIVVHYGTDYKFDLPFCRTRALKYGHEFPLYKSVYVEDTYSMSKAKLRLSRNRLENIATFFDIPNKQHKLQPSIWQKALAGDKASLDYIWKHNIEDIITLHDVWKKLNAYINRGKRSI